MTSPTKSLVQIVMDRHKDELIELMNLELRTSQTPFLDIILKRKTFEDIRKDQQTLADCRRRKEELMIKMSHEIAELRNSHG